MIRLALAVQFSAADQTCLENLHHRARAAGWIAEANCTNKTAETNATLPFHMNLASWLLPQADTADKILNAVNETQALDLDVFPVINLENNLPTLSLQPLMTHILNLWHLQMHKALELPYLADDERDVPKRWRPIIALGQAINIPILNDASITWPRRLRCEKLFVFDKDRHAIFGEQALIPMSAIPW